MATTFAVPDGRVAMAATLYTGNGSTQAVSNAVNTVSFQPDLVWIKNRTSSYNHVLQDSIRGATAAAKLSSNLAEAEGGANLAPYGNVSAFNSNGFSLAAGSIDSRQTNTGSESFIGWQWKAGGTAVSNTAGTITSSVSANTTAGFSIVTFTSPATSITFTVGHGLGVAPAMIFLKDRGQASYWGVYHSGATTNNNSLYLNTTNAVTASTNVWGTALPTNAVFGSYSGVGTQLNDTCVAYCWAPVAGYSAFGSYTGNGSTDGPFIYTGFRPRWLMIKNITNATYGDWQIYDASRSTYNLTALQLQPNTGTAEYDGSGSGIGFDLVSNGVKVRTSNASRNNSGDTFIYAAFAENPLKYANAR